MPRVSEEHARRRRRQILDAAIACFARQGFHRTTMQDIFAESGLSPGAVYTYFFGKDELVRAIADEGFALMFEGTGGASTLEQALGTMIGSFGRLEDDGGRLLRTVIQLWAEALRDPRVMELLRRSLDRELERLADLVAASGAGTDPDSIARATMALFHGLMLQRACYPELDVDAYAAAAGGLIRAA